MPKGPTGPSDRSRDEQAGKSPAGADDKRKAPARRPRHHIKSERGRDWRKKAAGQIAIRPTRDDD